MNVPTTPAPAAGPSRRAVVAAAVLVALLVAGVVLASRFLGPADTAAQDPTASNPMAAPRTGPVGLVPVEAPDAGSPSCASLVGQLTGALPNGDGTLEKLPVADPAPAGAVVWGDRVAEPVVLRCGLSKPGELTPTAQLRVVSGVQWLPVEGTGASTWFAVDRPVYVALTLPDGLGTGPLQTVSEVVGRVLPAQPVRP
ncbi:DUF3515 domain-containing protein [Actinokineospora spheciospongiae]|uniref:DUF3515 domain-containing protein n=1 Tax=Actinokineospora spheciospongiae TaxID=909613 RepID=UPI000D86EB06|nr:DUF3515 domain-containing protein [Actinokineospora spheciospongiae]PWW55358.1 uncharacterized protein DUF3515 [Actinokineospora spheciospongiae]